MSALHDLRTLLSESWRTQAACREPGVRPEWFFDDGYLGYPQARQVCARCPVIAQCAEAAKDEHYGFWAGKPRGRMNQRRRLREQFLERNEQAWWAS